MDHYLKVLKMKLRDIKTKPAYEGIFSVERKLAGNPWKTEVFEENLVVNNASVILRDVLYGEDDKIISKIQFGDMNLIETDNLKNVQSPSVTDTSLINKLYEKTVSKKKVNYDGAPAIEYSVVINENEFNGDGSQLITEYALANDYDEIFSIKTRAAVYKDAESSLRFTWTLVFN